MSSLGGGSGAQRRCAQRGHDSSQASRPGMNGLEVNPLRIQNRIVIIGIIV